MPKFAEYTAKERKLIAEERGFSAFEAGGRRTASLYSEIGEMGRGAAREFGSAVKSAAELLRAKADQSADILSQRLGAHGGGGGGGHAHGRSGVGNPSDDVYGRTDIGRGKSAAQKKREAFDEITASAGGDYGGASVGQQGGGYSTGTPRVDTEQIGRNGYKVSPHIDPGSKALDLGPLTNKFGAPANPFDTDTFAGGAMGKPRVDLPYGGMFDTDDPNDVFLPNDPMLENPDKFQEAFEILNQPEARNTKEKADTYFMDRLGVKFDRWLQNPGAPIGNVDTPKEEDDARPPDVRF